MLTAIEFNSISMGLVSTKTLSHDLNHLQYASQSNQD